MEPHCPCPSVMETGKSSAEKLQERPRDSTDQRGPSLLGARPVRQALWPVAEGQSCFTLTCSHLGDPQASPLLPGPATPPSHPPSLALLLPVTSPEL